MGSEFLTYLRLGVRHILDPAATDHLLFISALAIPYVWKEWRNLLWLVTAFTVGHSITLALATLDLVRIDPKLVEVLIPITILVTSLLTVWWNRSPSASVARLDQGRGGTRARPWISYGITLGFGLIHGLGFSAFLRALLGEEESLFVPLLSFNIGLEVAQIVVVSAVLLTSALVADRLLDRRAWQLVVSGATVAFAIDMIVTRV
ncbi:MAG: HupE/UreJ family protein [Gemmatimonadota bacterium]